MAILTHTFILAVAAGYVAAQISGISANCSSAILVVSNDPGVSTCLSPTTLAGLVTGSGSAVNVIDQWVDKICPAAPCSNATLATVVNTIVSGCSSEIASLGITTSASELVPIVQQGYPVVRQVVCLKDGNNNCITETLDNIQSATGQNITISTFLSVFLQADNFPTNVTCTNCQKAAYNIIAQKEPSIASSLQQTLQNKCGASFTDGTQPSGIVESASTASPTSSNSAERAYFTGSSSMMPIIVGLSLPLLIALSSALLLL